jgi:hypothetical protein
VHFKSDENLVLFSFSTSSPLPLFGAETLFADSFTPLFACLFFDVSVAELFTRLAFFFDL